MTATPAPTRADWVDALLRAGILSGELAPGSRLVVADLADRTIVLDRGRVIASGPTPEVLTDRRAVDTYFGTPPVQLAAVPQSPLLSVFQTLTPVNSVPRCRNTFLPSVALV